MEKVEEKEKKKRKRSRVIEMMVYLNEYGFRSKVKNDGKYDRKESNK